MPTNFFDLPRELRDQVYYELWEYTPRIRIFHIDSEDLDGYDVRHSILHLRMPHGPHSRFHVG
jgi:hypothetical protein